MRKISQSSTSMASALSITSSPSSSSSSSSSSRSLREMEKKMQMDTDMDIQMPLFASTPPAVSHTTSTPQTSLSLSAPLSSTPNASKKLVLISPCENQMADFICREYANSSHNNPNMNLQIHWIIIYNMNQLNNLNGWYDKYNNDNDNDNYNDNQKLSIKITTYPIDCILLPSTHLASKKREIYNHCTETNVNANANSNADTNNIDGVIICFDDDNNSNRTDCNAMRRGIMGIINESQNQKLMKSLSKVVLMPIYSNQRSSISNEYVVTPYLSCACPAAAQYALTLAIPSMFIQHDITSTTMITTTQEQQQQLQLQSLKVKEEDVQEESKFEMKMISNDDNFGGCIMEYMNTDLDIDTDLDLDLKLESKNDIEAHSESNSDPRIGLDVVVINSSSKVPKSRMDGHGRTDNEEEANAEIRMEIGSVYKNVVKSLGFRTSMDMNMDRSLNETHSISGAIYNSVLEVLEFDIETNVMKSSGPKTFVNTDIDMDMSSNEIDSTGYVVYSSLLKVLEFDIEANQMTLSSESSSPVYDGVVKSLGIECIIPTSGQSDDMSFNCDQGHIYDLCSSSDNYDMDVDAGDQGHIVDLCDSVDDIDIDINHRPNKRKKTVDNNQPTQTHSRQRRNKIVCGNQGCNKMFSYASVMHVLSLHESYHRADLPTILTSVKKHLICTECYDCGYMLKKDEMDQHHQEKYDYVRVTRQDYNRVIEDGNNRIDYGSVGAKDDLMHLDDHKDSNILVKMDTKDVEHNFDYDDEHSFIGRKLLKNFTGILHHGTVMRFEKTENWFKVKYDDGDEEEMTQYELQEGMELYEMKKRDGQGSLRIYLREYQNSKCLKNPTVSFLDKLGRCRECPSIFSWPKDISSNINLDHVLHFDKELGRVYFDRFVLQGKHFEVGDFIKETDKGNSEHEPFFYRIVGAYQAVKSFIGRWGKNTSENIQNRGFTYLLLASLITGRDGELRLWKDTSDQYDSVPIDKLPVQVAQFKSLEKITVHLNGEECGEAEYLCSTYRKKIQKHSNSLDKDDYALLSSDASTLLDKFVPKHWDLSFNSSPVLFMREHPDRKLPPHIEKDFDLFYNSDSDDSDGFDEESRIDFGRMDLEVGSHKKEGPTSIKKMQRTKNKRKQNGTPTPRKRKPSTSVGRTPRKKLKPVADLTDEWRVKDSKGEGPYERVMEVFTQRKENTFIEYIFGSRIRERKFQMKKQDPGEVIKSFIDKDGSVFELATLKEDEQDGRDSRYASFTLDFLAFYVQVKGPGVATISLQEQIDRIADFGSLTPRKAASRLELLQSPAAKLKNDRYALFNIKDENLLEIEDEGHTGCGFISEDFLEDLMRGNKSLAKVACIQVRIYAPNFGLFKGELMRKRILSGPRIHLPTSMKKVGPSKAVDKLQPVILVNNAGIDPSSVASTVARLKCIDTDGDGGPKNPKTRPKSLTDMIERLWIGLGVPRDLALRYTKKSDQWKDLNHVYLRGVADPTGKIPPGYIYITGIKNKETRNLLKKEQVFLTHLPAMTYQIAMMINVMTEKPATMSDDEFEWLESLPIGAIIFGFPSKGMLPIPETIDADLDGDRFFICWDKDILSSLKNMKRYEEQPDPKANQQQPEKSASTTTTRNENWLADAQKHMESIEGKNVKALVGMLYNRSKKFANDDHQLGIRNPTAEVFALAYGQALDNGKHGNKIVLPTQYHCHIKDKKYHSYFTNS